jgi:hypothetical protein
VPQQTWQQNVTTIMQPFHCDGSPHSLRHHFPRSPLPFVPTLPSTPLTQTTASTTLRHVLFCDVTILFTRNSKDCFPTSVDK